MGLEWIGFRTRGIEGTTVSKGLMLKKNDKPTYIDINYDLDICNVELFSLQVKNNQYKYVFIFGTVSMTENSTVVYDGYQRDL